MSFANATFVSISMHFNKYVKSDSSKNHKISDTKTSIVVEKIKLST